MNRREHAAILTGLRVLQNEMDKYGEGVETMHDGVWEIMTGGWQIEPLSVEEISALCERLNSDNGEYEVEG
jgi:hypothetical protein